MIIEEVNKEMENLTSYLTESDSDVDFTCQSPGKLKHSESECIKDEQHDMYVILFT